MADRQKVLAIAAGSAVVAVGIGFLLRSLRNRRLAAELDIDTGAKPCSTTLPPPPEWGFRASPPSTPQVSFGVDDEPVSEAAELREKAKKAKDLGNKRFQGRQYDKAVEEYTRAIELAPDKTHPDVAVFYGNRAQAHAMLEMHAQAESDCNAAIAIDPRYVKVYLYLYLYRYL